MVSLGPASAQPAERIAGKVDLAKFQWKVRDPRGLRDGAVARQELLATSKPEPSPPWRSWLKDEKTTKRDAPTLSDVETAESHVPRGSERRERGNYDRVLTQTQTLGDGWQATLRRRRPTDNNFL